MKRGIIFLTMFFLCSCWELSPDYGGNEMLKNTIYIPAWNVKKRNLFVEEIRPTKADIENKVAELTADGYTTYLISGQGDIDLSALANGKYLVMWGYRPDSAHVFNISKIKTIKNGSHTDVIIIGCYFTDGQVDLILSNVKIAFPNAGSAEDYNDQFGFYGFSGVSSEGAVSRTLVNVRWEKVNFDFAGSPIFYLRDCVYNECLFLKSGGRLEFQIYNTAKNVIQNCAVDGQLTTSEVNVKHYVTPVTMSLINVMFKNCPELTIGRSLTGTFEFENLYIEKCVVYWWNPATPGKNIIQYKNIYPTGTGNMAGIRYSFQELTMRDIIPNIQFTLDYSNILNDDNFIDLPAYITPVRKTQRGLINRIRRGYYNLNFRPEEDINDDLKFWDDDDLLVVLREEEETDLIGKKIKHMSLYESNGTTPLDYRNDESFLIVMQDEGFGIYGYKTAAWHKGQLVKTIFSDIFMHAFNSNLNFTIKRCFQIWQSPDEVSLRNMNVGINVTNCPVEGNILYQDITSMVIDL